METATQIRYRGYEFKVETANDGDINVYLDDGSVHLPNSAYVLRSCGLLFLYPWYWGKRGLQRQIRDTMKGLIERQEGRTKADKRRAENMTTIKKGFPDE
jgi:hypothetical protein